MNRVRKHSVPSWVHACLVAEGKGDPQLHPKQHARLLIRRRRAVLHPRLTFKPQAGHCFKGCYGTSSRLRPCHPRRFHRNHCFTWASTRMTWAVRSCTRMGSRTRRSRLSSTLARHESERCKSSWIGSPTCTPPRRPASRCHPCHPQVRMRTPQPSQGTPELR